MMTDLDGFPRGYRVWSEYNSEPDVVARLLAELIDTLDDIRNELNEANARSYGA